jgi:5-formyltetrahydrofolate cyclo-ligase
VNIAEAKSAVRAEVRARLAALTTEERARGSTALCRTLLGSGLWRRSRTLLLFAPIAAEPDIAPLINAALAEGRTVALPRFHEADGCYEAAVIRSADDLLPPARFGVREPTPRCPALPVKQLDLALVPGIAFDATGRRLGRGGGFYDRLLRGMTGFKCGMAFDCQMAETLPNEPHDVILNGILTPTRRFPEESAPWS